MFVLRRGMAGWLDEVLDGDVALIAQADALPVLLWFVGIGFLKPNDVHMDPFLFATRR